MQRRIASRASNCRPNISLYNKNSLDYITILESSNEVQKKCNNRKLPYSLNIPQVKTILCEYKFTNFCSPINRILETLLDNTVLIIYHLVSETSTPSYQSQLGDWQLFMFATVAFSDTPHSYTGTDIHKFSAPFLTSLLFRYDEA